MQAPIILCNIPILFAVSRIISRGSRFPAISSDSRINFAVLPKQIFLELAPPVKRMIQMRAGIQWNPDFSNTRLFETPDSSNQKSFPLDLLQSNTVILPRFFERSIFRNSRYFELILSSVQKFTFDFSNSESSGTNKNRFQPHTHLNAINKFRRRCFHASFLITKQVTNLSLKS